MINEEGGIDPEQFRMEAMFDRMDAIGKGVLGLTIQCAQCHNHKFDPITQEEYYRLFAFLNNDHEAQHARSTRPSEQMKRADDAAGRSARSRPTCSTRTPDWAERMAAWEDAVAGRPARVDGRPARRSRTSPPAARSTCRRTDGSFLAQGYAPTKHTRQVDGRRPTLDEHHRVPPRAAQRPEPAARRAGPLVQGHVRADRVRGRGRAGRRPGRSRRRSSSSTATRRRRTRPRRRSSRSSTTRPASKRVTGPVAFAIDGKDETAWGIDAGPGRRNVPRKAVFVAREADRHRDGGTMLTFYLKQNHGGWNSDDNQNNNLGRFRLSVTDGAGRRSPTRCRRPSARSSPIPREQRTPAQTDAVFSYWRTTVPEWKDANDADRGALEGSTRRARRSWCSQARDEPRDDAPAQARRLPQARQGGQARRPGVPASAAGGRAADAPDVRALAGRSASRRRPPARSSTASGRPTSAPASSRTSEDFGTQSEAPSHPELLDWLAVEFMDSGWSLKALHRLIVTSATYRQSSRVDAGAAREGPVQPPARPRRRGSASTPRSSATSRWRPAACSTRRSAARASCRRRRSSCSSRRPATARSPGTRRPAPTATAARSTPSAAARRRTRCSQTFDAPNGDVACVRRTRSNTPLQALTTLNEPLVVEAARALALRILDEGGTTDAERLTYAFRRCVSRPPTDARAADPARAAGEADGAVRRRAGSTRSELADRQAGRPADAARTARRPRSSPPGPSSPACC